MKYLTFLMTLFLSAQLLGQTKTENEVLQLSIKIFRLEVANKIDSLADYMHEKLMVVNSKGETQSKDQYIATFRSGNFIHNSIDIEEHNSIVEKNTATVAGKGKFNTTASGNNMVRHLSYIETFIKTNSGWKLFSLKASVLPN